MKNGVLRNDEGYSIWVDNRPRTFHDRMEVAFGVAGNLKVRNIGSVISVWDRARDAWTIVEHDGKRLPGKPLVTIENERAFYAARRD